MKIIKLAIVILGSGTILFAQKIDDYAQLARMLQESKVGKMGEYPRMTILKLDRNSKLEAIRLVAEGDGYVVEYCDISNYKSLVDRSLGNFHFVTISTIHVNSKSISEILNEVRRPPVKLVLEGSTYWVATGGISWFQITRFTDSEWNPCLSDKKVVRLFCFECPK